MRLFFFSLTYNKCSMYQFFCYSYCCWCYCELGSTVMFLFFWKISEHIIERKKKRAALTSCKLIIKTKTFHKYVRKKLEFLTLVTHFIINERCFYNIIYNQLVAVPKYLHLQIVYGSLKVTGAFVCVDNFYLYEAYNALVYTSFDNCVCICVTK